MEMKKLVIQTLIYIRKLSVNVVYNRVYHNHLTTYTDTRFPRIFFLSQSKSFTILLLMLFACCSTLFASHSISTLLTLSFFGLFPITDENLLEVEVQSSSCKILQ